MARETQHRASGDALSELVYENMLLTRHATFQLMPHGRDHALDRSAALILARLESQGAMTVAELSDALELDVSTIHRQLVAAISAGLVEKFKDTDGTVAKKHRATSVGRDQLTAELAARRSSLADITADWSADDVATFTALMRRFNDSIEAQRGHLWPRPE